MISFPTVLLRLFVALLLGALIGIERESGEHSAGLRTNALVALGTSLFTIISGYGFISFLNVPHVQMDPTRIASYIVAGIGFLGGGAIYFRPKDERVKGLTTAAAIWVVAAIGMACGAGMLLEAISATVLALIVLEGLRYAERLLVPLRLTRLHRLSVEVAAGTAGQMIGQIYEACTQAGVSVEKVEIRAVKKEGETETLEVGCRTADGQKLAQAVSAVKAIEGVQVVEVDVPVEHLQRGTSTK